MESVKNEELKYTRLSPEEMNTRGILGRLTGVAADTINPTRNGRKYSNEVWDHVFKDPLVKEQFENGGIFGEMNHPADRDEVDLTQVCVCMPEPPKKNDKGELIASWDILDTPNGRILKTLCDYGYKLGISSRGTGEIETDFDGNESVDPESYQLSAWDIVLIPAVKAARLDYVTEGLSSKKTLKQALVESLNNANDSDRKIMEDTLDNLHINLKEDYFKDISKLVKDSTDNYTKKSGVITPQKFDSDYINDLSDELKDNGYNWSSVVKDHSKSDKDLSNYVYSFEKIDEDNQSDSDNSSSKDLEEKIDKFNIIDTDYDDSREPWSQVKRDIIKKYTNKGYKNVSVEREKTDTKGLRMYTVYGDLDEDINKAVDNNEAIVEELQNSIKQNKDLQNKVITLQEKLSVSYAEENKKQEEITKLRTIVQRLSEDVKKKEALQNQIRRLNNKVKESNDKCVELKEQLETTSKLVQNGKRDYNSLNESVKLREHEVTALKSEITNLNKKIASLSKENADEVSNLTESLETLKKDSEQIKTQYSQKLDKADKLVEKYKKIANTAVEKYMESEAVKLGVTKEEIKNKLPQSYTFKDIDNICEELQSYKLSVNNLPFKINENIKFKTTKSTNESILPAKTQTGDEVDNSLLEMAGLL